MNKMEEQQKILNELGEQGWELVSVIRGTFLGIDIHREHTFKRPKKKE